jgi:general secretion pathway protein D
MAMTLQPATSMTAADALPATVVPGKLPPGIKLPVAPLTLTWQGASRAKVGEQFKIVVNAQAGSKVVDVPFKVVYDTATLQIVDVSEGDFLKGNNAKTVFSSNVDSSGGEVSLDISQPGLEGAAGRGSLAVLTFKVMAANPQAPISITGSAVNAEGDAVPVRLPAPHNVVLTP